MEDLIMKNAVNFIKQFVVVFVGMFLVAFVVEATAGEPEKAFDNQSATSEAQTPFFSYESGVLYLAYINTQQAGVSLKLKNEAGETVYEESGNQENVSYAKRFDLTNLERGWYHVIFMAGPKQFHYNIHVK